MSMEKCEVKQLEREREELGIQSSKLRNKLDKIDEEWDKINNKLNEHEEDFKKTLGMSEEMLEAVDEILQRNDYYECYYLENNKEEECNDDGFIHITRDYKRFCFYNGQERGMFTEKSVPIFIKIVERAIKKAEKEMNK